MPAVLLATLTVPALAQVSGPIIGPSGEQTHTGHTTDPDFSPYTPEQQRWDRQHLDMAGTGTAHVGSLRNYVIQVARFFGARKETRRARLGWTALSQHEAMVQMVGGMAGPDPIRHKSSTHARRIRWHRNRCIVSPISTVIH